MFVWWSDLQRAEIAWSPTFVAFNEILSIDLLAPKAFDIFSIVGRERESFNQLTALRTKDFETASTNASGKRSPWNETALTWFPPIFAAKTSSSVAPSGKFNGVGTISGSKKLERKFIKMKWKERKRENKRERKNHGWERLNLRLIAAAAEGKAWPCAVFFLSFFGAGIFGALLLFPGGRPIPVSKFPMLTSGSESEDSNSTS